MLSEALLAVLACPACKQPVVYVRPALGSDAGGGAEALLCQGCRRRYRVDGGVPVLLVEEGAEVDADEVARLVALAREISRS